MSGVFVGWLGGIILADSGTLARGRWVRALAANTKTPSDHHQRTPTTESLVLLLQGRPPRRCSRASCAVRCCAQRRPSSGTSRTSTPSGRRSTAASSVSACTAPGTRSWRISTPTTSPDPETSTLSSFSLPAPQVPNLFPLDFYFWLLLLVKLFLFMYILFLSFWLVFFFFI